MIVGLMLGALFASATASGIPQYGRSLEIIAMRAAVEDLGPINTNVHINSSWIPLTAEDHQLADSTVFSAVDEHLGNLVLSSTRLTKTREHWWGWLGQPMRKDDLASQSAFQFIEHIDEHITYLEGVAPTDAVSIIDGEPTIEVAVFADRARVLQLSIGDVVNSQPIDTGAGLVRAVITGTFEQVDSEEVFWIELGEAYLAPAIEGREQPLIMLTTSNSMFTIVAKANAGLPANYDWFLYTNQALLADKSVDDLQSSFDNLQHHLDDSIVRPFIITKLIPRLDKMKRRALFGSIPMLLMALLLLTCVVFYLTLASGLLGRRRVSGYMMLRSRGLNLKQQLGIHLLEAAIASVPAALLAPLISFLVIRMIGHLPTYSAVTAGSGVPVELSASAWLWSFGAAIGTVVVVTTASSFWEHSTMSANRSSDARPINAPWFQRLYIDALLVALSGIVWWEVRSRSSVVTSQREGELELDLSLLTAPALIVVATSFVALRLFPIVTNIFAGIGLRFSSTAIGLGLANVARRPFFHGWPMLALALSISTAIIAGSVVSTLERSTNEQVLYDTGADIHVITSGSTGQVGRDQLLEVHELDYVDIATPALRTKSTVGTTSIGSLFTLLAINPIDFQQVAWLRDDFSDSETGIHRLVDQLAVRGVADPIFLPPNTSEISIWAKSEPVIQNHELWIVLRDGIRETHTIKMGMFEEGWFKTSARISNFPQPVEITSIQTFIKEGTDSAPHTNVLIDDLSASTSSGQQHLVINFDIPELWTNLPTTKGEYEGFTIAPEPEGLAGEIQGDAGTGIGNIVLGKGSNHGIRGIYRRADDRPIPMIASKTFLDQTGVGIKRPFMIDIQGELVPVEVIETIKYFPTLDPERGPFAVVDVDAVIDFIELRGGRNVTPNELFVSLNESDLPPEEISEEVRDVFRLAKINSRAEQIDNTFVDPIAVTSWRVMSIVTTIVAGLIVIMAYSVFLAAYSLKTKGDSALILALGASTRDFCLSTISELLPSIIAGILIGIVTGFAVSSLMVGSMTHTGDGYQLIPPFMLQTNWLLPVVTIGMIFIIVIAGVFNAVRSFREIEIAHMAREGFSATST